MSVLTVETTSTGFKNLYAYCENNPIILNDSTGQAAIVIFGVAVGADVIIDWAGLMLSVYDVANNPTDPLAYIGLGFDIVDIFVVGSYAGDAVNVVKYSVRAGSDIAADLAVKYGDDAAELVVKNADEVVEAGTSTLAKYGDDFGKMGTYVENPNIKVDWTQYAEHAAERMQQRGMTQEGVAIVSKEGKLITAWSSADFDSSMLEIVSKLFGE